MKRRSRQWWLKQIAASLAVGALISLLLIFRWERGYADSTVTVLGSGDGLSALVELDATRILIISGDDASEFANALSAARPGQTPRIDLIVVTPGASRIASRAIEIVDPERVLVIDSLIAEPDPTEWPQQTTTISTVSTIVVKGRAQLEIDPGNSVDRAMAGWSIRIRTGAGDILVSQRAPLAYAIDTKAVVIAGADAGIIIPSRATMIASSTIPLNDPDDAIGVAPGDTMRIDF
jgi:hypothetical protein